MQGNLFFRWQSSILKCISPVLLIIMSLSCSKQGSDEDSSSEEAKYDALYSGYLYYQDSKLYYYEFEVQNGKIISVTEDSDNTLAISGTVAEDGSIEAYTELGITLTGIISNGNISGDWEAGTYSGAFDGYMDNFDDDGDDNDSENYSDLDADFNMIVENPPGTYGAYWKDPVSIEFNTSNGHFQNYSPAPEFSWKYHISSSGDLTDSDFDNLPGYYPMEEFSTERTYTGQSFIEEFELPVADTNYVYIRLDIKKPDGIHVVNTQKVVFPMIQTSGFLQIGDKYYSFEPEDVASIFNNSIEYINIEDTDFDKEYRDYSKIWISRELAGEFLILEIASTLPANINTPVGQLENPDCCHEGGYTRNGFYISYGNYSTFDDPNRGNSSGIWGVDQVNFIEGMQNSIELNFTLRGSFYYNDDEEIEGKLMLYNIYKDEYHY